MVQEKEILYKKMKTLIPKKSKKVVRNINEKNKIVDIDEINYSDTSSNANFLDKSEILKR